VGARIVGHKVGLTSAAMREQMGVSEPDSGVLLEDMAIPDGGVLRAADLLVPRVEAEFGFRLHHDLAGGEIDVDRARSTVSEIFLALEIIDSRFGAWDLTVIDSIADNASSARFVVGDPIAAPVNVCSPSWLTSSGEDEGTHRTRRPTAYVNSLCGSVRQWHVAYAPSASARPTRPNMRTSLRSMNDRRGVRRTMSCIRRARRSV
jgi:2-keto-4-pentenoate hydratase